MLQWQCLLLMLLPLSLLLLLLNQLLLSKCMKVLLALQRQLTGFGRFPPSLLHVFSGPFELFAERRCVCFVAGLAGFVGLPCGLLARDPGPLELLLQLYQVGGVALSFLLHFRSEGRSSRCGSSLRLQPGGFGSCLCFLPELPCHFLLEKPARLLRFQPGLSSRYLCILDPRVLGFLQSHAQSLQVESILFDRQGVHGESQGRLRNYSRLRLEQLLLAQLLCCLLSCLPLQLELAHLQ